MILTRTHDSDLITRILRTPELYNHISDDGSPPADEFEMTVTDESYFLIPSIDGEACGVIWFHQLNHITYLGHINMLPKYRGQYAIEAGELAIDYMLDNTSCQKMITTIPLHYKNVIRFTQSLGFTLEGRLKNAYLKNGQYDDLIIMGMSWLP